MNKNKYIIVGAVIIIFIIIISIILLQGNKKASWIKEILSSENYQITMSDCNGRTVKFPKEKVVELFSKWNNLSNNGPWTGDNNKCYSKVNITYNNNKLTKEQEIILIDDDSLVINSIDGYWYYTNSKEINSYLNDLFLTY